MKKQKGKDEIIIQPGINSGYARIQQEKRRRAEYERKAAEQKRKKRHTIGIRKVAVVLFAGAMVLGVLLGDGHLLPKQESVVKPLPVYHEVEYGDTLWSIAEQYHNGSEDIRQTYYRIMKDNNADGNLQPGQVLQIHR